MKSLTNFVSKALTAAYYIAVGLAGLFIVQLVALLVIKAI